ncbi:putative ADP-ribosylation factor GTPase-activating protein AGD14-like [Capsicum annuum]|nr:putative ADP-ribosylation factor GTPase-activating protein AGD14-like [Capsicum annuum]
MIIVVMKNMMLLHLVGQDLLSCQGQKRLTSQKIIHDPTAKEVVWQLDMVFKDVNEFRRAVTKYAVKKRVVVEKWVNESKKIRVKCKDDCPWLLYAGLDNTINDFIIKTYIPKHTCNKTTKNYLCNAKFLAETFRERIIEQSNIRIFNLQELIRKKFKLHIGKTTVRRAITKVLKDIMGDHVVEFGRILDYKDEPLRTNLGTSCVVKLGEANEEVVEKENTNIWSWFVKRIKDDLGLGEEEGLTLITDMQKKTPTEATKAAPQGKKDGSGRGRGRPKIISLEAITEPPQAKKERGRPKRTISVGATSTPLPTAPPVPIIFPASSSAPPDFCTSSSIDETTKRGMGSGRGNTTSFKRQRVAGIGVFQAENDFKVLNPDMPSSKIYSTSQVKVAR